MIEEEYTAEEQIDTLLGLGLHIPPYPDVPACFGYDSATRSWVLA
jgi:hypothetical protein